MPELKQAYCNRIKRYLEKRNGEYVQTSHLTAYLAIPPSDLIFHLNFMHEHGIIKKKKSNNRLGYLYSL